jgi:plasmid stabilization system protein ParE
MVVRLVWSPVARKDLLDIYIVIGLENPAAAERLYDRIEAKAEALSHHLRLGRAAPILSRARGSWSRGRISFSLKRIPTRMTAQLTGSRSCASSTVRAIWRT